MKLKMWAYLVRAAHSLFSRLTKHSSCFPVFLPVGFACALHGGVMDMRSGNFRHLFHDVPIRLDSRTVKCRSVVVVQDVADGTSSLWITVRSIGINKDKVHVCMYIEIKDYYGLTVC